MRWRLLAGVVAAVAVLSGAMAAARAATTFRAPVYGGDFPDPSVILVNGTYWAYATGTAGSNLQVMSSPDLRSWSTPAEPLPVLPAWALTGHTWAPGVIQHGSLFLMYYTVRDASLGVQCISIATAPAPQGPFVDTSTGPLVCQSTSSGSIDPDAFLDPVSGGLFLIWKSEDNVLHLPTRIWGQPLSTDGMTLAGGTSASLLLTSNASWQAGIVEGPDVIRSGSTYYLFYGANNYDTAASGIGYATSRSLLGAYANASTTAPWLGTTGNAQGPQGPGFFTDASGATRMAFAAWYGKVGYENGGVRSFWIGTLHVSRSGVPSLN